MKNSQYMAIISLFTLAFSLSAEAIIKLPYDNTKVIYGNDDRYEVDEYGDQEFIEKARSVAIRIQSKRLKTDPSDSSIINFPQKKLKNTLSQICGTERFVEEVSAGDCSGFLIAPNKLVTAGHCMTSETECTANKWVFDFKEGTTQFQKNNVYSCKKIIAQKFVYDEKEVSDYAVIELDRKVEDRAPLTHRKLGRVNLGTPLLVIGHPLGLSMKITDGAKVSRMNNEERERKFHSWLLRENYFTANLDAYGGNSGAPVFNKNTGKVEGILVQGADDFVFNNDKKCLESVHLSNSHYNTYEKVMRITKIPGL